MEAALQQLHCKQQGWRLPILNMPCARCFEKVAALTAGNLQIYSQKVLKAILDRFVHLLRLLFLPGFAPKGAAEEQLCPDHCMQAPSYPSSGRNLRDKSSAKPHLKKGFNHHIS